MPSERLSDAITGLMWQRAVKGLPPLSGKDLSKQFVDLALQRANKSRPTFRRKPPGGAADPAGAPVDPNRPMLGSGGAALFLEP